MMGINIWKCSIVLLTFMSFSCAEQYSTSEEWERKCGKAQTEKLTKFVLDCVKGANPHSDEEPEDWIAECRKTGKELMCPNVGTKIYWACKGMGDCRILDKERIEEE